MKIKILVAFIATATIIFLSCNWFGSKKKEVSNPLVGEWRVDSVNIGKDTSFNDFLLLAARVDSSDVKISFRKDSVFDRSSGNGVPYSFDGKTNELITKDSIGKTYSFEKLNDSLISLTTKDSTRLYLQK